MLFADDAALTSHTQEGLQRLVNALAESCQEFGLTISLSKTEIMGQNVSSAPIINIGSHTLQVVKEFTYLGSTISNNLSIDSEISRRIGRASTAMSRLSKRVWENSSLSRATKVMIYRACILSTLLYGSECWSTYMRQEHQLNTFHMRCLRRILGVTWRDHVPNQEILDRADIPSMYSILSQRRLRWVGHVSRMQDSRIPKNILYGELEIGTRATGRPLLNYRDVLKRDLRTANIDLQTWEESAKDRTSWRRIVHAGLSASEEKRATDSLERRKKRKDKSQTEGHATSAYRCHGCSKDCHSRIGLLSHGRRCKK